MKPALARAGDPVRNAELALIHTAKRSLMLTDDSYRGLIGRHSNGRTESAGELTPAERQRVIENFRKLGFMPAKRPAVAGAARRAQAARSADDRPQVGKLSALWYSLYQLGVVRDASREACAAFVCRHTRIAALRWNDSDDLNRAIECLKAWCQRIGFDPKPYKSPPTAPGAPQEGSFRPALIEAQWARLIALGVMHTGIHAGLDSWMRKMGWAVSTPGFLEDEAAEEAIRRLGHWIRRVSSPPEGADG